MASFFEGKNRFVQICYFLLFVFAGMLIFSALGTLIASLVYGTFIYFQLPEAQQAGFMRISQFFGSVGTFMVPALLFAYCSNGNFFSYNKLNKKPNYRMMDIVIVMSLAILPLVLGLAEWFDGLHLPDSMYRIEKWMRTMEEQNQEIIMLMCKDTRISIFLLNIVLMAIIPALGEELLFRGTLQPFLHQWIRNPHVAIWITAFIFSAIHFQISGFISRMLLGAYLGYLVYWSGSIWLPILAHFMHNSMSLITEFVMLRRGYDTELLQLSDIHYYKYILAVSLILTIIGIYFIWKNRCVER